jgi:hypothetical protein
MRKLLAIAAIGIMATMAMAQEMAHRPVAQTPAWQSLQSLVGRWDGSVNEGGKELPSHIEIRMTGGGSALMHWMDQGTEHEMITMFHPDMDDILATHYCAAHNQPRMKLTSATPKKLVFEFKDGTNIGPHDGHMTGLTIVLIDANHHDEEWSYEENGQRHTGVFHFTRVLKN